MAAIAKPIQAMIAMWMPIAGAINANASMPIVPIGFVVRPIVFVWQMPTAMQVVKSPWPTAATILRTVIIQDMPVLTISAC